MSGLGNERSPDSEKLASTRRIIKPDKELEEAMRAIQKALKEVESKEIKDGRHLDQPMTY